MTNNSTTTSAAVQPLVSVIMPAYNASRYIADAIESILNQDYPNIEVIVVDDGSSDGTPEVAEAMGERVSVIRQKNGGPAAARNRGISAAKGALLAFLDADDLWLPGKISAQVDYLDQHPETAVVYGVFLRWHANGDGSFPPPPAPVVPDPENLVVQRYSGWIYTELLLDSVVCIITAMIRKEAMEKLGGFDESLPTGEDYDFWLRMAQHFRADKLNRVLAYYRMNPSSTTKVPRAENNEYVVLKKTLDRYGMVGPDGSRASEIAVRSRLFQLGFSHGYFHFWSGGNPCTALQAFRAARGYSTCSARLFVYIILSKIKCSIYSNRGRP